MADWIDVQRRAKEEATFARETADKGANQIEQFYPELHPSLGVCSFTNTLGSYLIPDLLTSQGVVVDVYDWPTPESLVNVYGIDLAFLVALRDAGLVKICANLPVGRYEQHSWLFPLLADPRTIFRSIRTPAFFSAIDPDFENRRSAREASLKQYFASLPLDEIQRLCAAAKAAHPPRQGAELASVLSQWLERLASIDKEVAAGITDGFERHVIERTPELMRLQRLAVSPHSAYLGGMMKIERDKWASLFGEESLHDAILEGQVRFEKLNTYFSEVELNLDEVDLKSTEQWSTNMIRHSERQKILDILGDDEKKADLIAAEQEIRVGLALGGDRDPTRESIRAYVEKLERQVHVLLRLRDTVGIAAPVVFALLGETVAAGLTVAGEFISSKYCFGDRIRRLTERVIGKLRVVRILGKRDK